LAAAGLLCLAVSGCDSAKKAQPASSFPATNQPKTIAEDQPILSESDAAVLQSAGVKTPLSEADLAWQDLEKAFQPPSYPAEWQLKEPTKEEIAQFEKKNGEIAAQAADKAKDFYTRFPKHENAAEARKQEYNLLGVAVQLGNTNRATQLQALEEARLKDPELAEDDRFELRLQQVQRAVAARKQEGLTAALTELEKGARAVQKEFPKRPEVSSLFVSAAEGWLENNQFDKSRALAQEVLKGEVEEDVKDAVTGILKRLDLYGKPLNLKFTALDKREVDLQQMKGKVVLLDFWATWCAPCLEELPKVKAAYETLREQGFDIVGISFDEEKAALERLLASEKMPWPQHFDESGGAWKKFGPEFGITGLPTMWLVDKKGVLRDLNAREDLAGKVQKLLAEK
jgi:thiol-disulfide isomerase/thioredoxin